MKKLIIAAVALAAVTGSAFAEKRSYDLRDLQTLNGYSSNGTYLPIVKGNASMPLMVKKPATTFIDHTGEHQNSSI